MSLKYLCSQTQSTPEGRFTLQVVQIFTVNILIHLTGSKHICFQKETHWTEYKKNIKRKKISICEEKVKYYEWKDIKMSIIVLIDACYIQYPLRSSHTQKNAYIHIFFCHLRWGMQQLVNALIYHIFTYYPLLLYMANP